MTIFVKSYISEERRQVCQSCDQLSTYNICNQCGCFMPMKVKLAAAKCPLQKWNIVEAGLDTTTSESNSTE